MLQSANPTNIEDFMLLTIYYFESSNIIVKRKMRKHLVRRAGINSDHNFGGVY
jgi:hypothetical protein